MSLFSIVARENFLSIVIDRQEYGGYEHQARSERTYYYELTPDIFFIFTGEEEFYQESLQLVQTLANNRVNLREMALYLHQRWQQANPQCVSLEAVIGGVTEQDGIQYHIISPSQELESHYPKTDESLYYAHDSYNKTEPMNELARRLMMNGVSTIPQVLVAQQELYKTYVGAERGTSSKAVTIVIEKPK
ncbi:hypothetical protein M3182_01650 [Mesobacillus maritimus]|uniref:hypothetical protein n=1 Tax=Mesobacillus maritimus TaxID=1643336 RepID=UPI00203CBA8D|nr:hypothetical protein [Mesobacillus maritimus]MCM3584445.1 hypothetical protein [Mesobacillus maritimus]MCM3670822.1 hypothetical protein [Mesobacillus maritimus]